MIRFHTFISVRALLCWLVLPLVTSQIACKDPVTIQESAHTSVLDKIKNTSVLEAGYIVYPPFVTKDPNTKELGGFFIDVMSDLEKQMGIEIKYEECKWSNMVSGLAEDQFDIVVSGIFPTIPRAMEVAFPRPLMYVGLGGTVRKDSTVVRTVDDLRNPNVRIAVILGEVGHEYLKRHLPEKLESTTIIDASDIGRASEEVRQGHVDVALADSLTCSRFVQEYPDDMRLIFDGRPLSVYGVTVMIRNDDPTWLSFLNTAFESLEASGTLARLEGKYKASPEMWKTRRISWED